jgi:acetyl esterase/lipase
MQKIYFTLALTFFMINAMAQESFPLYPDNIPNRKVTPNEEVSQQKNGNISLSKISIPSIYHFPAAEKVSTGTAVIIFPGGGYGTNSLSHEGFDIAKKLNEIGVTAFVIKYRLPSDAIMETKEIGPLQDAQQAIKLVREKSTSYRIDPERIGIMGFSAGGHLASTLGTHYKEAHITNEKNTSLRPSFMILLYPVISFQNEICHKGSRENLLGKEPTAEKIQLYSNELQIATDTPPAFLVHASDDDVVVPANSIRFYEKLLEHRVSAELHIYQQGGHGFGLSNKTTRDEWFERCKNWMQANQWLKKNNK